MLELTEPWLHVGAAVEVQTPDFIYFGSIDQVSSHQVTITIELHIQVPVLRDLLLTWNEKFAEALPQ